MTRRLLNLLTALSLLLCTAASVLWVRGYWRYDLVAVVDNTVERKGDHGMLWRSYAVFSGRGVFRMTVEDHEMRIRSDESWPAPRPAWEFRGFARTVPPRLDLTYGHGWLGFSSAQHFAMGSGGSSLERHLTVPHWAVVSASAVVAIPLMMRVRSRRANQRHYAGLCRSCGYNLTGNVSRVCPECGQST